MAGCFLLGVAFIPLVVLVASLYIIVTRATEKKMERLIRKHKK
jgi:preprotein translocase subunit YajC